MLVPAMGLQSICGAGSGSSTCNNGGGTIASMSNGTWTGSSVFGEAISGTYGTCLGVGQVGNMPGFTGAAADPVLTQNFSYQPSSDLVSLQANVAALQASVSSLQSTVNSQAALIGGLQGNVNTLLNAEAQPFDVNVAMSGFAFFFSTTLFFYAISRGAGAVLEKIRRPLGHG